MKYLKYSIRRLLRMMIVRNLKKGRIFVIFALLFQRHSNNDE